MVRGIFKEVEGIIALTIFILFLIFYLNVFRTSIFVNSENNELIRKIQTIDNIYSQLKKEGYIVSFRVYIPKYSKEILCNLSMSDIKRDFCEKVPIFIPSNLSFLFNYDGVLNNTYNTIFKKEVGAFLYLNFSEFICSEGNEYILVEVEGPINYPKILFVTTPTLYYWLKNNYNISVTSKEDVKFEYCYLLQNGTCLKENYGKAYGIVIKINNLSVEKATFNISRSSFNTAGDINIYNLEKIAYKINYEPTCYKDFKFLILENLSFNFSEYNDLKCLFNYMGNLKLSYTFRNLSNIYFGLQFYNEDNLKIADVYNLGLACIRYYRFSNSQEILNAYRALFSNTSWFIEIAEYNLSKNLDFNLMIDIFEWIGQMSIYGFYARKYFNFINFSEPLMDLFILNKLILKKEEENRSCSYILLFFEDVYTISLNLLYKNIILYPRKKLDPSFLKPTIYYYCFNYNDLRLLTELYFGYSIPKYELLYVDKISYLDFQDLKDNNITFYLLNKNVSLGEKRDKQYSKSYYTYIKMNNSLIEDYLIIYIK